MLLDNRQKVARIATSFLSINHQSNLLSDRSHETPMSFHAANYWWIFTANSDWSRGMLDPMPKYSSYYEHHWVIGIEHGTSIQIYVGVYNLTNLYNVDRVIN